MRYNRKTSQCHDPYSAQKFWCPAATKLIADQRNLLRIHRTVFKFELYDMQALLNLVDGDSNLNVFKLHTNNSVYSHC
jgi:hypothetical protein